MTADLPSTDPTNKLARELIAEFDLEKLSLPAYLHDLKPIKVGGMGAIYRASRGDDGKTLAVKVLLPSLLQDQTARKRFIYEAKAIALLTHPNIVSVFDYGVSASDSPYIVMEYLKGSTLWNQINNEGPMTVDKGLEVFVQCADALGHAHSAGLIHRDLKPSNIMLVPGEKNTTVVKIVDFGIAKFYRDEAVTGEKFTPLTMAGDVVGTPLFMSPEQCLAKPLDARSDVYAFGCVMYFVLTGKMAVDGVTAFEIFAKHCEGEVDFTPVPDEMRPIVRKCLEKEEIDRYQSMDALKKDLNKLIQNGTAVILVTGKVRKKVQKTMIVVVCFILAYIVTYLVIVLLS